MVLRRFACGKSRHPTGKASIYINCIPLDRWKIYSHLNKKTQKGEAIAMTSPFCVIVSVGTYAVSC